MTKSRNKSAKPLPWMPSKQPYSKYSIYISIALLIILFILTIFGFVIIFHGFELFCITFFESKDFQKWFKNNGTCP